MIFFIGVIIEMAKPISASQISAEIAKINRSKVIKGLDGLAEQAVQANWDTNPSIDLNDRRLTLLAREIPEFSDRIDLESKDRDLLKIQLLEIKLNYILKQFGEVLSEKEKPLYLKIGFYFCTLIIWVLSLILKPVLTSFSQELIVSRIWPEKR